MIEWSKYLSLGLAWPRHHDEYVGN